LSFSFAVPLLLKFNFLLVQKLEFVKEMSVLFSFAVPLL